MLPLFFLVFLTLKSHGQNVTTDTSMSKSKFLCAGDLYCSENKTFFFQMEELAKMLEERKFVLKTIFLVGFSPPPEFAKIDFLFFTLDIHNFLYSNFLQG